MHALVLCRLRNSRPCDLHVAITLNIYAHVLAEQMEQFERAKVLGISGTYRAPEASRVAHRLQSTLGMTKGEIHRQSSKNPADAQREILGAASLGGSLSQFVS